VSAGILDINRLADELRLLGSLYAENILTNNDVATSLRDELPAAIENNLVVLRPGNRVLIHRGEKENAAIIYSNNNTPEDTRDDKPDTVYFRLGNRVFLFFPSSLEAMLTRAIPFVIAGLAVALVLRRVCLTSARKGSFTSARLSPPGVGFDFPQALTTLVQLCIILAALLAAFSWIARLTQNATSTSAAAWGIALAGVVGIALIGWWVIDFTGRNIFTSYKTSGRCRC